MKILVVGGGGREHAIVWRLSRDKGARQIFACPGNAGISQQATCTSIADTNLPEILSFARRNAIDLTVVGPEAPLALGIADLFQEHNLKVFGPGRQASQLESSKIFAKLFLKKYHIPTAGFDVADDFLSATKAVRKRSFPLVVKYDALAAGKGVRVAQSEEEADSFLRDIFERNVFSGPNPKVVIEDCLQGPELSYLVFTDGEHGLPMVPARDYKRVFDQDRGPNTGGMGSYSPPHFFTGALDGQILDTVVRPTLHGLQAESIQYRGVLYFGLMLTKSGPFVLEYNVRFGDPETQVILPRLESDFLEVLLACAEGDLRKVKPAWTGEKSLCVILASGGYPGRYETGKEITGLDRIPDATVFHAGTRKEGSRVLTSGGRVLGVAGTGADLKTVREKVYSAAELINFEGRHYRRDIGLEQ